MVELIDCIACMHGDHDHHVEMIHAAAPGLMGGARCPCTGDCAERNERLPGPVATDASGYVWPTWREALQSAAHGIEAAYEHRRRVMQAAYDAGLTMKQIGNAMGLSPAGVNKIIGRQRGADLDTPAFQPKGSRDA